MLFFLSFASKMRLAIESRVILLSILVTSGSEGSATNSAASVTMGDSGGSLVHETGSTPAVSSAALSGSPGLLDEGKSDKGETESSSLASGGGVEGEERGGQGGTSKSPAPITAPRPSLDNKYEIGGDYLHRNNLIASNHRYVTSIYIFS